jgi:hypothetical protein
MGRNVIVRRELQTDGVGTALVGSPARTAISAPGGSIGGAGPHFAMLRFSMTWAGVCATAPETTKDANSRAAARLPNNVVVRRVVFMISPSLKMTGIVDGRNLARRPNHLLHLFGSFCGDG